jgi:hypothetical protein
MLASLVAFLGGSVFRMIWGEVAAFMTKRQDHEQELALLKVQSEADQKTHERSLENMRLQNELGIKTIEVQRESLQEQGDSEAFTTAMKSAFTPTGLFLVDLWNGIVRPSYATIALFLWFMKLYHQKFVMDDFDMGMVGVVSGFFFADRSLRRNGK